MHTGSGGYGTSDGVITHAKVDRFIDQSQKDLKAITAAYEKFLKNHPAATDLAKENALGGTGHSQYLARKQCWAKGAR